MTESILQGDVVSRPLILEYKVCPDKRAYWGFPREFLVSVIFVLIAFDEKCKKSRDMGLCGAAGI